jgi:hypothetical protein
MLHKTSTRNTYLPLLICIFLIILSGCGAPNSGLYKSNAEINSGEVETYTFDNGDVYIGEWLNDEMHGQATYIFKDGARWEGMWKNNQMNGYGVHTAANGDEYRGQWEDDKFHGYGTFQWSNGDRYVGFWIDDKQHGQGSFTWANGQVESGVFKEGKLLSASNVLVKDEKFQRSAVNHECVELGFTPGTKKFYGCVLELSK